ncbi:MAG TPA: glycosyltransferase [Polyangiaceae bacterium]
MTIVLVEPEAGGRLSGGFLYNSRMEQHGAWTLLRAHPQELTRAVQDVSADLLIADSLWLTDAHVEPFLKRKREGTRVAVLLHSFPESTAAAEAGLRSNGTASPSELDAVRRFGLALLVGPHYERVLREGGVMTLLIEPGVDDAWRCPPRLRAASQQPPSTGAFRSPTSTFAGGRSPETESRAVALVSVGAITRRKGFLDVLEALRESSFAWEWTIVGSPEVDPAYAEPLVRASRQGANVRLAGQRSPAETRAIVQSSDLLVMPSYDENHPLVLMEALAASVPSIVYAAGNSAGLIEHGRTGLVAEIGDRLALAAHLERLASNELERLSMARACWERQRTIPSWAVAAERARALLDSSP